MNGNQELFFIAISVASLAVIALAGFGIVLSCLIYSYQRAKLGKPDPDAVPQLDAETRDELARLRARLATLERLATDGDRHLASEIDRLSKTEVSSHA